MKVFPIVMILVIHYLLSLLLYHDVKKQVLDGANSNFFAKRFYPRLLVGVASSFLILSSLASPLWSLFIRIGYRIDYS